MLDVVARWCTQGYCDIIKKEQWVKCVKIVTSQVDVVLFVNKTIYDEWV